MKYQEGFFNYGQGSKLYYQNWLPDGEIKAVLWVVHRLAEHSGSMNRTIP
jgi:alpha-beta hydrolase superfamily lysophospholipase